MQKESKIYVAGHRGMVGSAIVRRLQADGYHNIVTRTSAEIDLRNQEAVQVFFCCRATGVRVYVGCEGGWHRGQQYLSR